MKAIQINQYSKKINVEVRDMPVPKIQPNEVLIRVITAAVNPLELLQIRGEVKLIQSYKMPLTLGNECAGVIEKVGADVTQFSEGERVFTRLPLEKIGAFAEYAAVREDAIAKIPEIYDFDTAVAIPLTGLTAYQAITEDLGAKSGETVLIPGGSGSFGQIAVPIAKALGLKVIVTGNNRAEKKILALGADRYMDYRKENYWEILFDVDYVIDTLGEKEYEHELSVLKKGGKVVSLRAMPNKAFAEKNHMPFYKKILFGMAGRKYDKKAQGHGKTYRFLFVRSDGKQLQKVAGILAERNIIPEIDSHYFTLEQAKEALELVDKGKTNGKVILRITQQ